MNPTLRFDDSPPGAWRAALDRSATCAVCRQSTCRHSDLEYAGLAAPRSPTVPLPEAAPVPPVHEAGNG